MRLFIGLQSTYQFIECVLWHEEDFYLQPLPKEQASAQLIPTLNNLLAQHQRQLSDVSCIIANQGPGPFTSLRTIIATVNGINFASNIPLIGINGLSAFLEEYKDPIGSPTVVLLNAFHHAIYFGIQENNKKPEIGYENIDIFLAMLDERFSQQTIRFLGNGTKMYQDKIMSCFQDNAYIPEPLPLHCSLKHIMQLGIKEWQQQRNITKQIEPLYLKHPVN